MASQILMSMNTNSQIYKENYTETLNKFTSTSKLIIGTSEIEVNRRLTYFYEDCKLKINEMCYFQSSCWRF